MAVGDRAVGWEVGTTADRLRRVNLDNFIAGLPKAELHVHHVGSASPRIVAELAERHPGVVPADPDELRAFFEFRDFAHFVEVYLAVVDLIRTPEDVRMLTYEVAREMAAVAAVRRAHLHAVHLGAAHIDGRGIPIEAYTEAIEDARVAAERDFGLVLRWIYDIPGESGLPAADATLDYALHHAPDALVGFGLGGPEIGVPRPQFQPHFDAARAAGLHSVPHAGETTGPQTVWDALTLLGAERIGHGTSAAGDPELLAHLARHAHPARGVPDLQPRHPRRRVARRPSAAGLRRGGRAGHDQLRRPADVRHHPQPGVRRRRRAARPRRVRGWRGWRGRRSPRRARPKQVKSSLLAEIAAYPG